MCFPSAATRRMRRGGGRVRFGCDGGGLLLLVPLPVALVALVLAPVVASAALHLLKNAEPVLSSDQFDILAIRHPADRLDQQGVAAGVRRDAAAAAEHVEADAHVLRA